jgi:hypothetical protein
MGTQVWGTFAVKDHCRTNAFVCEIMLFGRLVIPVPETDAGYSVSFSIPKLKVAGSTPVSRSKN